MDHNSIIEKCVFCQIMCLFTGIYINICDSIFFLKIGGIRIVKQPIKDLFNKLLKENK